jgi:acyl-CoA synthetase (AMP-forming)/AMP-acid ligase II
MRHGLAVKDFVLLPPGGVPRTSSGKVARSGCRERYLAGTLDGAS